MRLRNRPWAMTEIENHPDIVIPDPAELKGKWSRYTGTYMPVHLEIGTGKGRFLTEMAQKKPTSFFIGLEMQTSVIALALQHVLYLRKQHELQNVCLIRENASLLTHLFEDGEVETIYLNFSDPWPKYKHRKRRLTHSLFLNEYRRILGPQGSVHLKTDNEQLFEYSLNSFAAHGFQLQNIQFDLHGSARAEQSSHLKKEWYEVGSESCSAQTRTEYEQKFVDKGQQIYRCEAVIL